MLPEYALAGATYKILEATLNGVTGGALEEIGSQVIQAIQNKTRLKFLPNTKNKDLQELKSTLHKIIENDHQLNQTLQDLALKFERQEAIQNNQTIISGNKVDASGTGNVAINTGTVNNNLRQF